MKQILILIDDTEVSDDLTAVLNEAGITLNTQLSCSKSIDGKMIVITISKYDGDTVDSFFGEDLDFKVIAEEGVIIDQSLILPYMLPCQTLNSDGDEIDSTPETDITNKLQTFSGRVWSY